MSLPRQLYIYKNVTHIFNNNIYYIAGLISLQAWYRNIRPLFAYDEFSRSLIKGMQDNLDLCIKERIYRLKIFCEKLNLSKEILLSKIKDKKAKSILIHEKAMDKFKLAEKIFKTENGKKNLNEEGEKFICMVEKKLDRTEKKYKNFIQSLKTDECEKGIQWLFNIEQKIMNKLLI